ncbi:HD domain-containing protein [Arthrobacter echini]|uniref:HD domain-containing protein n=2 Tax=Arthrobacter echini TaxID=1529066 RepID=A0A4S5E2N3_9MICC|nr:HD domain-containing protein [Arthrobacter echini]THJ65658.1 HD domain-containing protein [Arthrobacter echini]TYC95962.1 HD domain-containing protein [Arthrobacter echini]
MKDIATPANIIAATAHDEQTDKAGAPYITHPARVAAAARHAAPAHLAEQAEAVGWLHDVVEDASVTIEQLRALGFPEPVLAGVDAMTKRHSETVEEYFTRVRANALACIVKKADLDDNTNPERLGQLDAPTRARLATKYQRARTLLALDGADQ